MQESQRTCARVHRRLEDILTELQEMETTNQLPPMDALTRYTAMLHKYLEYLTRYRSRSVHKRLLQYQKLMDEVRVLNEEVDTLMQLLNVATAGTMMNWKQQWEEDRVAQTGMLSELVTNSESVLSGISTIQDQMNALMELKYEMQQMRLNQAALKPVKRAFDIIVSASSAGVPSVPPWYIPEYDLTHDSVAFARGSFGILHRGTWGAGAKVVVKTLLVDGSGICDATKAQFLHEIEIWYKLNHPNVVKMFGACPGSSPPFIVCEDATNGNLSSFLSSSSAGKRRMWRLLYEAALGLAYLHKNKIVHGDLKLNSVLVRADGGARVADFGLSFVRRPSICGSAGGAVAETQFVVNHGGLRWRAPECLAGRVAFESDVYSLAMCFIEALTGEPPFGSLDDAAIETMLRSGSLPHKSPAMSDDVWRLIQAMAISDAASRLLLADVISQLKRFADQEAVANARLADDPAIPLAVKSNVIQLSQTAIPDLLGLLRTGSGDVQHEALKWLFRHADDKADSHAIQQADGFRAIVKFLYDKNATLGQQLYAFGALSRMRLAGAIQNSETDDPADCIQVPTSLDLTELLGSLTSTGDDDERAVEAIEKTRCLAVVKQQNRDLLRDAGLIDPLVHLLRTGTPRQLGEVTRTLRFLTVGNKLNAVAIADAGAIPLLLNQLDTGSDERKQQTALTLGCLAAHVAKAASSGVVGRLMELMRVGNDEEKGLAADALSEIVSNNDNSKIIAEAGAISKLVDLLQSGTGMQKQEAASALARLATNEATRRAICKANAIDPLITLARDGDEIQKRFATSTLGKLGWNSDARGHVIVASRGITIFVDLLRNGSTWQKVIAANSLAMLACNSEPRSRAVVDAGAVAPLVDLVRGGAEAQKIFAAVALAELASESGENRRTIGNADAIGPLVRVGTEEQKDGSLCSGEAFA